MIGRIGMIVFAGLVLAITAVAQESGEKTTLPDDVIEQVVRRILSYNFKPRRAKTTIPLAESQVRPAWLPIIENIKFVLVPDREIPNYEDGVFVFEAPERIGNTYSINVGWGDVYCFGEGRTWKFKVVSARVRLWPSGGWARGCGSSGSSAPAIPKLELGELSPNELKGYEFLSKGKLRDIRPGISTHNDLIQIFGSDCSSSCKYDSAWTVRAEYISDGLAWTTETGEEKFQFFPKEQFVGKLGSLIFHPTTPISFRGVVFSRTRFGEGKSMAIGDAWGANGFEGAVHTSSYRYADGYGLTYVVYDEETFNNLINKLKEEKIRKKGDLIEIEYSIPDSLNDKVYDKRPPLDERTDLVLTTPKYRANISGATNRGIARR